MHNTTSLNLLLIDFLIALSNTYIIAWHIVMVIVCHGKWREHTSKFKSKGTSFGRAAFSYSAVQPQFNIIFPWSLCPGLPGETVSLAVLCAANIRRPGISNMHRPIHTLVEWSLGDSFLVPREIHFRPV